LCKCKRISSSSSSFGFVSAKEEQKKTKSGGGLWAVVVVSVRILGVGCKQTTTALTGLGGKEKTRKKREEIHRHTHNWVLHL